MLVKSMGRGGRATFGGTLEYMLRSDAVAKDGRGQPIVIRHNISGSTIQQLEGALMENELHRRYPRKGQNLYYHDVLSFDPRDTKNLDNAKMEALVREYVRLRNENCMAVAAIHEDTDHRHVHVLLSGVEIGSGMAIRVTKEEFRAIKEELQAYQQRHYPELVSVVEHGKGDGKEMSDEEYQMKQRTGRPSRKDEIREMLRQAYDASSSKEEFYQNIEEQGLELYERSGSMGIDDNRKYRLSTLGYGEEKLSELEVVDERMKELEQIRDIRSLERDINNEEMEQEEKQEDSRDEEELQDEVGL